MAKSKKNTKEGVKKDTVKDVKVNNSALTKIKSFELIKKEYVLSDQELVPVIVLQKLAEHTELYIKIIQQILQPEEFHSMYECLVFTELEKQALLDLYKQIMILHRELLKSEIINEEDTMLKTIETVYQEISKLKPTILKIVVKMQNSWDVSLKSSPKNKSTQYFG